MKIGGPTEIKVNEKRVFLAPKSCSELIDAGHNISAQQGAGAGIAASYEDYVAAGAEIMPDAVSIFSNVNTTVKVKEPQRFECSQLSSEQILFTYLHRAANSRQAAGLMSSGCTTIAYEIIIDAQGSLPLLVPRS